MRKNFVTFCFLALPCLASTGFALTIDQSLTAPTGESSVINDCCAFVGQTYTAGISGTLAGVSVDIFEELGLTYLLDIQIRSVSGGFPADIILGETTTMPLDPFASSASRLSQIITFPQLIPQIEGTQYAIVADFLEAPPQGSLTVGVWLGAIDNPYPGGFQLASEDFGKTWSEDSDPESDEHFTTYVNATPEPASLCSFGAGVLLLMYRFANSTTLFAVKHRG